MTPSTESTLGPLRAAGLPEHDMREWSESFPITTGDFEADTRDSSTFWRRSTSLLRRLPLKPCRNRAEQAAAEALMSDARASRESFLAAHVEPVYDRLTERGATFRRLDDLVEPPEGRTAFGQAIVDRLDVSGEERFAGRARVRYERVRSRLFGFAPPRL